MMPAMDPPECRWRYYAESPVSAGSPAVAPDGTVIVHADDGFVHALAPEGDVIWKSRIGFPLRSAPTPAIGRNLILTCIEPGQLVALDFDGSVVWRLPGDLIIQSPPTLLADDSVLVSSSYQSAARGRANSLLAFDRDGAVLWTKTLDDSVFEPPSVCSDGSIVAGTDRGALVKLAVDGTTLCTAELGLGFASSPIVGIDDEVITSTYSGRLYCLSSSFEIRWAFSIGEHCIYSEAVVDADGTVYVSASNRRTYAISRSGALVWRFAKPLGLGSAPAVARSGMVYVGSRDHHLYAIDPSGYLEWVMRTDGAVVGSPAIPASGGVVSCLATGEVAWFEDDNLGASPSPWPLPRGGSGRRGAAATTDAGAATQSNEARTSHAPEYRSVRGD